MSIMCMFHNPDDKCSTVYISRWTNPECHEEVGFVFTLEESDVLWTCCPTHMKKVKEGGFCIVSIRPVEEYYIDRAEYTLCH